LEICETNLKIWKIVELNFKSWNLKDWKTIFKGPWQNLLDPFLVDLLLMRPQRDLHLRTQGVRGGQVGQDIALGGLNDEDTKKEVLSKVYEMPLDETITFVEARETGKTAFKIPGGKLTSGQVNKVQQDREDQRS
jgi:hypothetical protein